MPANSRWDLIQGLKGLLLWIIGMYLLQRLACGVAGLRYGRGTRNMDNTSDMLLEIFKNVMLFYERTIL
jgi:hypothetical protein